MTAAVGGLAAPPLDRQFWRAAQRKATSKLFASEGAKVVIAGIVPADGAEVVADVKANGGEALYVDANVTKPEDLDNLVECAVEAYGGMEFANAVLETCSLKRFGQPEDIANVCLLMIECSPRMRG